MSISAFMEQNFRHFNARETLAARKPLRFDVSGPVMKVNGRPFPQARFESRGGA
jgi:hypothetical protein